MMTVINIAMGGDGGGGSGRLIYMCHDLIVDIIHWQLRFICW